VIEGHYFETLRIPLLRGRTFNDQDDENAPRRVMISQAAARVLFGTRSRSASICVRPATRPTSRSSASWRTSRSRRAGP
jgi:hypothetical protein